MRLNGWIQVPQQTRIQVRVPERDLDKDLAMLLGDFLMAERFAGRRGTSRERSILGLNWCNHVHLTTWIFHLATSMDGCTSIKQELLILRTSTDM